MPKLPKEVLQTLNFANNSQFFKGVKQLCKKFGVSEKVIYSDLKEYGLYDIDKQYFTVSRSIDGPSLSIENEKFEHLLHDNNIDYTTEFQLGNYFYDFKIGNILVEINPSWTHNSSYNVTISRKKVQRLPHNYHYLKTSFAVNLGYVVINVFEWNNVIDLLPILKGEVNIVPKYRGIQEHQIKLTSSARYKSFIVDDDGHILKEAICSVFDDGYDLFVN